MTIIRRLPVFVFCALLLTACEIRSYLDIDMADLSNGTVSVQVGFDEQFREAMEDFGGGADLLGELETDAPAEGWTVGRFVDGGIEGVTLSKEFSSLEELQEIVQEGRISGPQEGLVGEMTFTDTGDTIRFEADVPENAELGGELEGFDPEQLEGLLTYDARIRVTFPGEVIDHNGELVENTVTWAFDDPASMAGAELFAEAKKGASSVVLYLVAAVLGLGVVALVVWQVLSRRKPPAQSPMTDGPVTEAPVTEGPVTEAPVTEAPVTEAPVTEAPVTEGPVTEGPVTEGPVTEGPVTEAPIIDSPVTDGPATEGPVTSEPVQPSNESA